MISLNSFSINSLMKLVLIALLLWLSVLAGQMGYANLQYFSASNKMEQWSNSGAVVSENSYNEALESYAIEQIGTRRRDEYQDGEVRAQLNVKPPSSN